MREREPEREGTRRKLNQKEILILAAGDLAAKKPEGFTLEDLADAAYERDHDAFGLKGFKEKYVDNHKVNAAVMGKDGMAQGGKILAKVRPRIYVLTAEGGRRVRQLLGRSPDAETAGNTISLTADEEELLGRLTSGAIKAKIHGGSLRLLTLPDAFFIWNLTGKEKGGAVDTAISSARKTLLSLQDKVADRHTSIRLHTGETVSTE